MSTTRDCRPRAPARSRRRTAPAFSFLDLHVRGLEHALALVFLHERDNGKVVRIDLVLPLDELELAVTVIVDLIVIEIFLQVRADLFEIELAVEIGELL